MLEVFKGGVPVIPTLERWYEEFKLEGYGAMIPFIGIVRPDNGIEGLSFDLYLPMNGIIAPYPSSLNSSYHLSSVGITGTPPLNISNIITP